MFDKFCTWNLKSAPQVRVTESSLGESLKSKFYVVIWKISISVDNYNELVPLPSRVALERGLLPRAEGRARLVRGDC